MGGACGAPRLLGIYLISKMHTKTIQKIQKANIRTYEEDVKIYKDIENSQGQGAFFLKTPVFSSCQSQPFTFSLNIFMFKTLPNCLLCLKYIIFFQEGMVNLFTFIEIMKILPLRLDFELVMLSSEMKFSISPNSHALATTWWRNICMNVVLI